MKNILHICHRVRFLSFCASFYCLGWPKVLRKRSTNKASGLYVYKYIAHRRKQNNARQKKREKKNIASKIYFFILGHTISIYTQAIGPTIKGVDGYWRVQTHRHRHTNTSMFEMRPVKRFGRVKLCYSWEDFLNLTFSKLFAFCINCLFEHPSHKMHFIKAM